MTTHPVTVERLRGLAWPVMMAGGLLLVLFAQVQWGSTDEGVEPSITGLGRVTILGASDDDVAFFFEDNTGRPGLSVVVLGAVIALVAALGWWRPRLRPSAVGLIGLASIVVLVVGIRTLSDPAAHLFSDRVSEALDADLPEMQAGYGLIGTVVVGILLLAAVGFWVLSTVWPRSVAGEPTERTGLNRTGLSQTDESS
ncbi:hypothetical protein ACLTEW_05695 [Gordonia lacunae]|uniref:hypothetical protein n=1 Tax=Gordonia lacunae TaxID=417102 RepID=UPI0039E5A936